jgi:(S)-mandelate dehydrogenase
MSWRRSPFRGSNPASAINIDDLRQLAQRRVPGFIFEYLEGGAEDEATLRTNREAIEALRFVPSTLIDTTARHQRISLFGRDSASPLIIGPTGGNGMVHPQGDIALARAAAAFGIPFCLSTLSTKRLETVAAEAGGRLWMQLYVPKRREIADDIITRAAGAGYEALVFTTDANVAGAREWDRRSYRGPGRLTLRAVLDLLRHPRWIYEILVRDGVPRLENVEAFLPPGRSSALGASTVVPGLFGPTITWDDISWLRDRWSGKLLIKGVLSVADARRAAALGCDGIVLSNHGGRQLDYCVAPVEVLPGIAAAVGRQMTILVDGGFRRGTDAIKALALGAHGVLLGRATLYGLAAGGEGGARRALEILTGQIDRTLGLLGCRSIAELTPDLLQSPASAMGLPGRSPEPDPAVSRRSPVAQLDA